MVHRIGLKAEIILEFIPFDDWIISAELSEKTGFSSRLIGQEILRYLVPAYVIRKKIRVRAGGDVHAYQRRLILHQLKNK